MLHDAAWAGALREVRRLLRRRGIDVDGKDELGLTPLHCAAWSGHLDVARVLVVDGNANVEARNE